MFQLVSNIIQTVLSHPISNNFISTIQQVCIQHTMVDSLANNTFRNMSLYILNRFRYFVFEKFAYSEKFIFSSFKI